MRFASAIVDVEGNGEAPVECVSSPGCGRRIGDVLFRPALCWLAGCSNLAVEFAQPPTSQAAGLATLWSPEYRNLRFGLGRNSPGFDASGLVAVVPPIRATMEF